VLAERKPDLLLAEVTDWTASMHYYDEERRTEQCMQR